jgi:hypothetical protein
MPNTPTKTNRDPARKAFDKVPKLLCRQGMQSFPNIKLLFKNIKNRDPKPV